MRFFVLFFTGKFFMLLLTEFFRAAALATFIAVIHALRRADSAAEIGFGTPAALRPMRLITALISAFVGALIVRPPERPR